MADQILIDAIAQSDLILAVDDTRNPYDLRRLTAPLRDIVTIRLAAGRAANAAVAMAGGDVAGATLLAEQALARMGGLLRNGLNGLKAIPEEDVPAAELMDAMETYGWVNGNLGDLDSKSRIISLTETGLAVTPNLPVAVRYPANITTRLTTWLGVYNANKLLAGGGSLQTIIDDKDAKRDLLRAANSRVRHHYCAGGDEGEYTVELALIGDQPKRLPGDAQPQPFPDDAGASTFNGPTREITVVVFPAHASSIVAFRKPLGGAEEQCGVSVNSIVGVSDFSPMVPGVTYELSWAGKNSRGFGKRSAAISFTA